MFDSVMKDICARDISVLNKPDVSTTPHKLGNYFGVACTAKTREEDADIDSNIAGKPILFPDMLRRRQYFVPLYAAIWVLVLTGFWLALTGPHAGLVSIL